MKDRRSRKPSVGRVEKQSNGWRARRYYHGQDCRGPVRYTIGAALADLPMLHMEEARAQMYREALVAVGKVGDHGAGYRARVSRMKARTRATEAEAFEDLVALRMLHGANEECMRSTNCGHQCSDKV